MTILQLQREERSTFGCDWFHADGILSDIIESLMAKVSVLRDGLAYHKYSVNGRFQDGDGSEFTFSVFVQKGRFVYRVSAADSMESGDEQWVPFNTSPVVIASKLVDTAKAIRQACQEPEVDYFSQENIVSRLRRAARVPGATAARAMMGL